MEHANVPIAVLEAVLVFLILYKIFSARRGRQLYIRRIPGLNAIDEAVGRATEMGRPMMFSPGINALNLPTLQALSILRHVTAIAAKYRTRVIVPTCDSVVYTIAEEISKDAYNSEGRPGAVQPGGHQIPVGRPVRVCVRVRRDPDPREGRIELHVRRVSSRSR